MTALAIRHCGPMTSLQDRGRLGWRRYGVSASGAMDGLALAAANALVGNAPGEAGLELTLLGGAFEAVGGPVRVALACPPCPVSRDGETLPPFRSVLLIPGQVLTIGAFATGVFGYLAVQGGLAVAPMLGSLSLQLRAGLGGLDGRKLAAGDVLPLRAEAPVPGPEHELPSLPFHDDGPVRVVLGPQDDHFPAAALETFLGSAYTVSPNADRMGYRLTGPRIEHAHGFNIVSDGIVAGSVQVPGNGAPIVMLADGQTTGGYPKIATVITADLRRVAQSRPGSTIGFRAVTLAAAREAAIERAHREQGLAASVAPLRRTPRTSEELLGLNLAGAAANALDPCPEEPSPRRR